ncbi:DNA recombination protein RmuC [Terasakiella sp. A23]|uniref:DNA recombination protein RmuC n=1 Tax=Terasakiella sp. FCG-A23 TaxID=3080561 RepID=UPI002954588E|nr:DNA recombination protein RmuC [Terasakiella sp. A23]MDV7340518.1 DNA recombination protein RmuC [Terasakiella sp. A23]
MDVSFLQEFLANTDLVISVLVGLTVISLLVAVFALMRKNAPVEEIADPQAEQMALQIQEMSRVQAELTGRLAQMNENQNRAQQTVNERLQTQERAITKTLDERLNNLTHRMGEGLLEQTKSTAKHMSGLAERLAVIDTAQKNIMDLSQQMVGLQDILSNKQTRGAFGEVQLEMLVTNALPPSAYSFQETLSNTKRVDCLLNLPNPPGSICIDSKFPLESYQALQASDNDQDKLLATRTFKADVLKHIKDISEKYIIPGETAESALMFLPSESIYAELHANFTDVVEKSYKAKVWIVSPTTLMATLNTVRAVLKDARMREEAGRIQKEVMTLLEDVGRLDKRIDNLDRHFSQTTKDIRDIQITTGKITKRGERIEEIQLGEDSPAEELAPPRERIE